MAHSGSSPRMRGTDPDADPDCECCRFIPAHAGNRLPILPRITKCPVHPRACGEQRWSPATSTRPSGSSPRMRGTGTDRLGRSSDRRFIPAHAGNRATWPLATPDLSVHPRACGEQGSSVVGWGDAGGSSPRMRGTAIGRGTETLKLRFIPAHAGNRLLDRGIFPPLSVHPRACGEQLVLLIVLACLTGSSPRMRGTGPQHGGRRMRVRFIPAHAGNSALPILGNDQPAVHPRACGEQLSRMRYEPFCCGSSPRMRGTGRELST